MRMVGNGHSREKTFKQRGRELFARQLAADRPADQFRATTGDDQGRGGDLFVVEQRFLRGAARMRQATELPGIELGALRGQLSGNGIRQRKIHVVPAKQDVFADCNAVQFENPFLLKHGDQGEIAGSAADVDNQNDL